MGATGGWLQARGVQVVPDCVGIIHFKGERDARTVAAFDGRALFVGNAEARAFGDGKLHKPIRGKGNGKAELVAIEGDGLCPLLAI